MSARLVVSAVFLVFLAGCDAATPSAPLESPTSSDAYARLLNDVGGVDALVEMLDGASEATLDATFARHGMTMETVTRTDTWVEGGVLRRDIRDCPQRFPVADRTKWFRLVGAGGTEFHYIDSRGRPEVAYKSLGPVTAAPRQTSCQAAVGNWEDPGSAYDGGHLIGSQLGGWGGRANLAPQQLNFNRGNWKRVEDRLARCGRLGTGAVRIYVDVDYPDASTLTPSQFHADVQIGGVWNQADFANTPGGGSRGASEATAMVSWLASRGCA